MFQHIATIAASASRSALVRDILHIARLSLCVIAVAGIVMGVNIATYAM